MKASLLFNQLINRFLDDETHLDILMRTGHYAEPEHIKAPTVVPCPETLIDDTVGA